MVNFNGKHFRFEKGNRIINFIINGESQKRFIYSYKYLKSVLKELNIDYYSTTSEEKLNNSMDSEISDKEIFNIFDNIEITTIYKVKTKSDIIIDKFKKRYPDDIELISNLSLNAKFYYPENYNDELNFDYLEKYDKEITKNFIYESENYILYLIGPKGTSKSIFLMEFFLMYNMDENPTLYINYRKIKNLSLKERINIFKKEMIYLFFDEMTLREFYRGKYHKIIKSEINFLSGLKRFLEGLLKIYENTFPNKKIILIIDNFDENDNKFYNEMEKIIELVKYNGNKIKLILSGNCKFINNKLKLFLINKNFSSAIDNQILLNYYVKIENNNEIKTLPAFYFRKNLNDSELEEVLLKEEMEYCKKFNVFGMNYAVINCGNKIELEELLSYFDILPIDYLNFEIDDDFVIFNFYNPIFLKAIKNKIKIKIKEHSLSFLLKEINEDQIVRGIYEEKLLTLLISYNKLNLKNWKFYENNLLEIEEIAKLKDYSNKKNKHKIDDKFPIVITQEKFKGQHYDLLILLPNEKSDKYFYIAYMIQIGVNKNKEQINIIEENFKNNKDNYIKGIKNFIGGNIKLDNIELLFIFDKKTQMRLKSKNKNTNYFGFEYCKQKNIKNYLFSINDFYLYITPDMIRFYKVYKFGNFDINYKRDWNDLSQERFYFLNNREIQLINLKIKDNIGNITSIYSDEIKGIPKNIDDDKIYILKNKNNSYYIINNVIYNLNEEEEFEIVSVSSINDNESFSLHIINDNKKYKFENKEIINKKKNK